jgi:hypothetical protein
MVGVDNGGDRSVRFGHSVGTAVRQLRRETEIVPFSPLNSDEHSDTQLTLLRIGIYNDMSATDNVSWLSKN